MRSAEEGAAEEEDEDGAEEEDASGAAHAHTADSTRQSSAAQRRSVTEDVLVFMWDDTNTIVPAHGMTVPWNVQGQKGL